MANHSSSEFITKKGRNLHILKKKKISTAQVGLDSNRGIAYHVGTGSCTLWYVCGGLNLLFALP